MQFRYKNNSYLLDLWGLKTSPRCNLLRALTMIIRYEVTGVAPDWLWNDL